MNAALADATLTRRLESAFNRIWQQRMTDVPMLNPALGVEAVGFREWQGRSLGVMITPWFMNLMLLPGDGDDWSALSSGAIELHAFPSGRYEFIVGDEDEIGPYQMCSLFSPVFEFADHEAAVATARAVMDAVMDEANNDGISTRAKEIESIWSGEAPAPDNGDTEPLTTSTPKKSLSERVAEPISRRELLRGSFLHEEKS
jgi:[NiFe] hydrogenase assembly HybE family chaperone